MNLFVTVIVLLGIAVQVSQVSAKACKVDKDCTNAVSTTGTCDNSETCTCKAGFVPAEDGCDPTTLATPEITGEKEVGKWGHLSLVCNSESDKAATGMTYEWKRDTKKIDKATSKTYSVKDVTEKYKGDYVCTTKFKRLAASSATFKVDVIGGVSQVAGSLLVVFAAALVSRLF